MSLKQKIQQIFAETKFDKLLMMPKWNKISEIAESRDVYVRKDNTICLDIVDIQGLITDILSDFEDLFLKRVLALVSEREQKLQKLLDEFDKKVSHGHIKEDGRICKHLAYINSNDALKWREKLEKELKT